MKIGDIVKIRNSAGILEIEITEQLDLRDSAIKGICPFTKCRVEFHKDKCSHYITTLYDQNGKDNLEMFVINTQDFDIPQLFKAKMKGAEKDELLYETTYNID